MSALALSSMPRAWSRAGALVLRAGRAYLQNMARKKTSHPFPAYAWLAEAGWVFAMHSAQLWANPTTSAARLATLGAEKRKAFAEGAIQASAAALRGAKPETVFKAAMAPARRCVRANAKKIQKG
ncbi:MAG: hypothetical protein JWR10_4556 [Rubritepida sp.]|nr:hypothetical protein [Rubritepida sp.]